LHEPLAYVQEDASMVCPRCSSENVTRDGTTQLGGQRFRCSRAVSALGLTLKLEMVPALLTVTRSSARTAGPPNGQHAQSAAQAIEKILRSGPLDPQHLRPKDEELLRQVFETLRYVAEEEADTG
jgi:hypothetical protein